MTEFHLLIDDVRELNMDLTVRTSAEGKRALAENPVTHLYMDHDLGEDDGECRNGYEVLTWALDNGHCPPKVYLVTMNPVGKRNMVDALEAYGYEKHTSGWYIRSNA